VPGMSDLQRTIARLAEDFAASIIKALGAASLTELTTLGAAPARSAPRAAPKAAPPRGVKKAGRRSGKDLQGTIDAIVATLKTNAKGMRSEQLQRTLGLAKADLVRPIKEALEAKTIKKSGQKRATTYFAV